MAVSDCSPKPLARRRLWRAVQPGAVVLAAGSCAGALRVLTTVAMRPEMNREPNRPTLGVGSVTTGDRLSVQQLIPPVVRPSRGGPADTLGPRVEESRGRWRW